jgi:Family of unknown function (DUF6492)
VSAEGGGQIGLSALLPLKVSGRHYGDNLGRLDLLFSSLIHHGAPGLLDEVVVVVRGDELAVLRPYLARWRRELPLQICIEDEHFPAFRRFQRPWQVRPWQRQQIIKLNAAALTTSPFVLMLDPDVIAVKPITREILLPGGRALLEPEPRGVHPRWWRDSAQLLDVDPSLDRPGMGVTPAVLSTASLDEVQRRLEDVDGRRWMEVLLTSYCDWTEYTLYLLAAERVGLVNHHHLWADDPAATARLQLDPAISVWDAAAVSRTTLERLFAPDIPGLFAVAQSGSGLSANDVAAVAANHFPVRKVADERLPALPKSSKLGERFRSASRLAAQGIYRLRRSIRPRSRRSRRSLEATLGA